MNASFDKEALDASSEKDVAALPLNCNSLLSSLKMSFSCPPPVAGIPKGTALHEFTLAVIIVFPFAIATLFLIFYLYRNTSVYLRKRPLKLLAVACVGSLSFWASTVLYDYLGSDRFPCALFGFLVYAGCPLVGGPLLMKGLAYGSMYSVQSLRATLGEVKPVASSATFGAHVRVIFCGSRSKADRLMSAQFSLTPFFWIGWSTLTVSPYVIAYLVRLGTDPLWNQGCSGCHLSESDLITLIVVNAINMTFAFLAYSFKVARRDSLRIFRECLIGIGFPMPLLVACYVLALIDPGKAFANGAVNWVSFTLIPATLCVYVQTVHQVLVARSLKRKILFSENFDRADKLEDVMNDKNLKTALRSYLNSELSGEILMFMDACNDAKAKYAQDPVTGEADLRAVYHSFIEKNKAAFEVNLPSSIREAVAQKMKGSIDASVFDAAYEDVRNNLLRDGFPRFLNTLKSNPKRIEQAVQAYTSRVESKFASKVEDEED